ncbi:MAG TPA: hypothetical protein DCZ11_08900 [Gammaproteobacteria bacterium]|nr:hypothetical protein [Gammaproteobacteria bacterium]MCH78547.1 hypothetical protein [Gammaproteobacteria bacterium]
MSASTGCRIEVEPRPPELGGGWRLRLIEDGAEVGGGIFPPTTDDPEAMDAYADALTAGYEWTNSRSRQ